jgi:hypothetical protein
MVNRAKVKNKGREIKTKGGGRQKGRSGGCEMCVGRIQAVRCLTRRREGLTLAGWCPGERR